MATHLKANLRILFCKIHGLELYRLLVTHPSKVKERRVRVQCGAIRLGLGRAPAGIAAEASGLLIIVAILGEGRVNATEEHSESGSLGDQPEPEDDWMLHTPGGGPLDSRCPCLASNICPRPFGLSPMDVLILGHLPICKDESKVRCCGASFSVETGTDETTTEEANAAVHQDSPENVALGITENSYAATFTSTTEHDGVIPRDDGETTTTNFFDTNQESPSTVISQQDGEESTTVSESGIHLLVNTNQTLNQSDNSDMVYIENLRPDVLLYQDTKGFIQESEDGTIMVVTPIPLTPRAKYQQQLLTDSSQASQLGSEDDPSHVHMAAVPHVTHRPEGEVMVITPLSVEEGLARENPPFQEESNRDFDSLSQAERPHIEQELKAREKLGMIASMEGFTERTTQNLQGPTEEEKMRVKDVTGAYFKPIGEETLRILEGTSLTGQELSITAIRSNTVTSPTPIHALSTALKEKENSTGAMGNARKEFGDNHKVRLPKRPAKARVTRPTWSPKRLRTRQPENLDSRRFPRQGTPIDISGTAFQTESALVIPSPNKSLPTRSTISMTQESHKNHNVHLEDSPSTTSIKYVPVPMNKIDILKLQAMLTSPISKRVPNSLIDHQQTLMVGQTFPFPWGVDHYDDSRKVGATEIIHQEFPTIEQDPKGISKRQQERKTFQQNLLSVGTSLRQWWKKNAELAHSKEVRTENQQIDSSPVKIDLLQQPQQPYLNGGLYDYKYDDSIFGAKTIFNQ
ncbi:uncharacterized protein LOC124154651 [Ischnura elegans]|uniref:uncharacterized protein LOC124154651 n=1 Tax=Ischnura elegans TaxID=197161 RepID=UPI001ED8B91E|nr:uncharacterized protein LOC124154651 [Ischnura elegans]